MLFVASQSMQNPATALAVQEFEKALKSPAVKAVVEVHEMAVSDVQTAAGREEIGKLARVRVLNSSAKVVACLGDAAITELAGKLSDASTVFVVGGLQTNPAQYGLARSGRVVGVWSPPSVEEAMLLAKSAWPQAARLGVLADEGPLSWPVLAQLRARKDWPMSVVAVKTLRTKDEWVAEALSMQNRVDVILCVGMTALKDSLGNVCGLEEVAKATAAAVKIPTVAFQRDAVMCDGLMMAVAPPAAETGRLMGDFAIQALTLRMDQIDPKFVQTKGSDIYINAALADRLNIRIPTAVTDKATEIVRPGPETAPARK